jgi:hypothetical protein
MEKRTAKTTPKKLKPRLSRKLEKDFVAIWDLEETAERKAWEIENRGESSQEFGVRIHFWEIVRRKYVSTLEEIRKEFNIWPHEERAILLRAGRPDLATKWEKEARFALGLDRKAKQEAGKGKGRKG